MAEDFHLQDSYVHQCTLLAVDSHPLDNCAHLYRRWMAADSHLQDNYAHPCRLQVVGSRLPDNCVRLYKAETLLGLQQQWFVLASWLPVLPPA